MAGSTKSPFDISYVGRALRFIGWIAVALNGFMAVLHTDLYLVSSSAAFRVGLDRDLRRLSGGMLVLLAGVAISTRKEWGRLLARKAVLVSSLFGLSSLVLAVSGIAGDAGPTVATVSWFAAVAYEWYWLNRADIRAQFEGDGSEREKARILRLAPVMFVIAGIVAVTTCDVEIRARSVPTPAAKR